MPFPTTSVSHLGPNPAVLLGTCGLCLIFYELNRPGRILPGAVGLLFFLFATADLLHTGLQIWPACVLLLCTALLIANVWRKLPVVVLLLTAVLTIFSLRFLCRPPATQPITTPVAVLCGGVIGALGALLGGVAYRARRAKALD